jgi:zinc transport system substrate-binding protein
MRIILSGVLLAGMVTGLAGCGSGSHASADGRQRVVASFFPLAEAARAAGGDKVRVRDLTPSGAEPHDLELTPDQVDAIDSADLVVVMGHGFQPAVEELAKRRGDHALFVLDALGVSDEQAKDPHVWLDPVRMQQLFHLVRTRLGDPDPASANAFAAQLRRLDASFTRGLRTCARRTIVTAHEAFGYLAARYDLTQDAIAGVDPEQEPSADRIGELADLVRRDHVTTVFTEQLVSPRVADTLAREAGVQTAVLDPLESADAKRGSYLERMRSDLDALRAALGCT